MRPLIFAFVDYVYDPADGSDESVINFHETNVTLAVDLTAGFNLTGIAVVAMLRRKPVLRFLFNIP
jgi:hypothetical protein